MCRFFFFIPNSAQTFVDHDWIYLSVVSLHVSVSVSASIYINVSLQISIILSFFKKKPLLLTIDMKSTRQTSHGNVFCVQYKMLRYILDIVRRIFFNGFLKF